LSIVFGDLYTNEFKKKLDLDDNEIENTISSPDKTESKTIGIQELKFYLKKINQEFHILVETELKNNDIIVHAGFPIRNDFENLANLSPIEILEQLLEFFGFPLTVDGQEYKLVIERAVIIPQGVEQFKGFEIKDLKRYCPFILNSITKQTSSGSDRFLEIILAYCLDNRKYKAWFESGSYEPYIIPVNAAERADRFVDLRLKVREIKNKQTTNNRDVRNAGLNNCSWAMATAIMTLELLSEYEKGEVDDDFMRKLFKLKRGDVKTFLETYAIFARFGFQTMIQFQIENMFKNILAKLTNAPPPQTYYKIVQELIQTLSLQNPQDKIDKLNVIAMMRNSLHSNGIHTKESKTVIINGHKYEFIQNQTVTCSDWAEMHFALNEVLKIIDEILDHSDITAITDVIPDQYVTN